MEMEHINENTIRVLIKSEDLAARGITFLDLLGNHTEIENFFYSILEEVDIDDEFRGSEAVTFQVLPKGDGLELFISKNVPAEELSRLEEIGEGNQADVQEFLQQHVTDQLAEDANGEELTQKHVFEMSDFEQLIQLANEVRLPDVTSSLYQLNHFYFLEIGFNDDFISPEAVADTLACFAEYARKSRVTPDILQEHGKLLMAENALEQTRYYFDA